MLGATPKAAATGLDVLRAYGSRENLAGLAP